MFTELIKVTRRGETYINEEETEKCRVSVMYHIPVGERTTPEASILKFHGLVRHGIIRGK